MKIGAAIAAAGFLVMCGRSEAAVLGQPTLDAWNDYVKQARAAVVNGADGRAPFLWIDQSPGRRELVRKGQVVVAPVGANPIRVADGLIHDWVGAAFLPNTTIEDALAVVRDYGRYKEFYRPLIVDSQPLGWDGAEYRFSIVVVNKTLFSKTALRTDCGDSYFQVDGRRWYSIGSSDRVREIVNYGQPSERELPAGQGSGYIWRLYSFSRFEERDGGVYVEREVIALSRDIPASLRWLVEPIVNRLSRNSLTTSLLQTRAAVRAQVTAAPVRTAAAAGQ